MTSFAVGMDCPMLATEAVGFEHPNYSDKYSRLTAKGYEAFFKHDSAHRELLCNVMALGPRFNCELLWFMISQCQPYPMITKRVTFDEMLRSHVQEGNIRLNDVPT